MGFIGLILVILFIFLFIYTVKMAIEILRSKEFWTGLGQQLLFFAIVYVFGYENASTIQYYSISIFLAWIILMALSRNSRVPIKFLLFIFTSAFYFVTVIFALAGGGNRTNHKIIYDPYKSEYYQKSRGYVFRRRLFSLIFFCIGGLFVWSYMNSTFAEGSGFFLLNGILCFALAIIFWKKGNVTSNIKQNNVVYIYQNRKSTSQNNVVYIYQNRKSTSEAKTEYDKIRRNNLREYDKSVKLKKKIKKRY